MGEDGGDSMGVGWVAGPPSWGTGSVLKLAALRSLTDCNFLSLLASPTREKTSKVRHEALQRERCCLIHTAVAELGLKMQ